MKKLFRLGGASSVLTALLPLNPLSAQQAATEAEPASGQRPMNIIFYLVDDMGYGDLGYLGNRMVESPAIDAFAAESSVFTNAYAAPESSPTRASLLTGKNPARLHLTTWIPQKGSRKASEYRGWRVPEEARGVALEETLISEALKAHGYDTWHIGKWHIGEGELSPRNQGFDSDTGYWPWSFPRSYFSPYGLQTLQDGPEGEYLTDRLTDEAVKLIKNHSDRPFFLNLWHYAVHEPLRAKDSLTAYYRAKGAPEEGKNKAVYTAMKHSVDENFAKILKAVEEAGIEQNTVIVFFTDNGGVVRHADNGPLRQGKKYLYEGGIRVPLVIRDPRHPGARRIDTPVSSIDFYPTMLEWAGIDPAEVDQLLDGVSIAPLLRDEPIADRALFWHEMGAFGHGPATAMRQGNYKLLRFYARPADKQYELYDLSEDIGEQHDLSAEQPERVKRMAREMQQWIRENGAQLPTRFSPAGVGQDHRNRFRP